MKRIIPLNLAGLLVLGAIFFSFNYFYEEVFKRESVDVALGL